jgi:hypothetical protein
VPDVQRIEHAVALHDSAAFCAEGLQLIGELAKLPDFAHRVSASNHARVALSIVDGVQTGASAQC